MGSSRCGAGTAPPFRGTDINLFAEDGDLVGVIGALRTSPKAKSSKWSACGAKTGTVLCRTDPAVTYIDRIDETSPPSTSPQVEEMLGCSLRSGRADTEF